MNSLHVTIKAHSWITMLTFGGKQYWQTKMLDVFVMTILCNTNDSYTVFQSGLNFYIFETKDIVLHRKLLYNDDSE